MVEVTNMADIWILPRGPPEIGLPAHFVVSICWGHALGAYPETATFDGPSTAVLAFPEYSFPQLMKCCSQYGQDLSEVSARYYVGGTLVYPQPPLF
jgi:hypothetical protein